MTTDLPLSGVRIVDFTWVGAGPLTTRYLADFGADVIKIESPARPDVLRVTPPFAPQGAQGERSGYFAARNANKRSLALDLRLPEAREIARRLVEGADVVANSFAPGVMERWDLGYDDLRAIRPGLIYLEMPMLGREGPYRDFSGFGATLMAVSGLMEVSGYPDRLPVGTGTNYPDHVPNPMHAAFAVLAALLHRNRTGRGQQIEVAQLESTVNVMGELFFRAAGGEDIRRQGNVSARYAPHGVYPAAGEDRWLAIAVADDAEFASLCAVIGQPRLAARPDYASFAARQAHAVALDALIGGWTASLPAEQAMERLQAAGIAAGMVQDAETLMTRDPNAAALGMFHRLPHPEMGETRYLANPVRMSRTPPRLESAAPLLGEHTREILRDLLSMTAAEIETAQRAGAFGESGLQV